MNENHNHNNDNTTPITHGAENFVSLCRKGDVKAISELIGGENIHAATVAEGLSAAARKGHFRAVGMLCGMTPPPSPQALADAFASAASHGHVLAAKTIVRNAGFPMESMASTLSSVVTKGKHTMARAILGWASEAGLDIKSLVDSDKAVSDFVSTLDTQSGDTPTPTPRQDAKPGADVQRERKGRKRNPKTAKGMLIAALPLDDDSFQRAVQSFSGSNFEMEEAFDKAITMGRPERAVLIAKSGLNPIHKSKELLLSAVSAGSAEAVAALFSSGLKPMSNCSPAFAAAIAQKRFDICRLFSAAGFDPAAAPNQWTSSVWTLSGDEVDELWACMPKAKSVFARTSRKSQTPLAKILSETSTGRLDFHRLRDEPEFASLSDEELDARLDQMAMAAVSVNAAITEVHGEHDLERLDEIALRKASKMADSMSHTEPNWEVVDRKAWEKANASLPKTEIPPDEQSHFFKVVDGEAVRIRQPEERPAHDGRKVRRTFKRKP